MSERKFKAVDDLVQQAKLAAAGTPDHLLLLAQAIKAVIEIHDDPHALAGALIEGVVSTIALRIPEAERTQVAAAAVGLLVNRLREARLLD